MNTNLNYLKYRICELAYKGGDGHVPSALSVLDIVWVIYNNLINLKLIKNKSIYKDHFIMSKGHGCLAQYVLLEDKKIIKKKKLNNYLKFKSNFGGHPDSNKINGIEASTGSLGHGFPFAAGISYAKKIKNIKSKTYCLIGDGECNEGTIWETCLLASHHKLNNLICIIDKNKSTDRALRVDDLSKKFKSFGWYVIKTDGHAHKSLIRSLKKKTQKPLAIIAYTKKGNGIRFMEKNQHEWHHKTIDLQILNKIKTEIIK